MPQVDLISESFVVADPAAVASAIHDEQFWPDLWPGLQLSVHEDRGAKGIRWTCSGALVGSCEVWLQEYGDGVFVHCYLRADPPPGMPAGRTAGSIRREIRRREVQVNRIGFALKDRMEGARPAASGRRGRSSADGDLPNPQA